MSDMDKPNPGDRVTYLDFEGTECTGTVTAFVPDAGHGFPGFVCWDPIREGHRWGYISQITEINGVGVAA